MTQRIQFTAGRTGVRLLAQRLAGVLSGRESDPDGVAQGFLNSLGFGMLSDIKDAFITKSQGGTDEMGVKWPPLSKEYLAYGRRFGKNEQRDLKKAAGVDSKRQRFGVAGQTGLLTAAEVRRWKQIFSQQLARWLLSLPEKEAKARAGQVAWSTIKKEGAKTKLEVYGNRQVEINHDTGVLFNSMSPGVLGPGGASYTKPSLPGGELQEFESGQGRVAVGSNVAYAAAVDRRRQILPRDESEIPDAWWERWLNLGMQALEVSTAILARRAA